MNKLEKWLLRRIAKKAVMQGGHKCNIIEFYKILVIMARDEFHNDTKPKLDQLLQECHKESLKVI